MASYDDLVEFNRAGMDATLKASEAILKATSSLAEELTRFACQRLRTDVETGGALLNSSNDWGQAVNLQGKFAVDAVRDYLEEMNKVTQFVAQTTRNVRAPSRNSRRGSHVARWAGRPRGSWPTSVSRPAARPA